MINCSAADFQTSGSIDDENTMAHSSDYDGCADSLAVSGSVPSSNSLSHHQEIQSLQTTGFMSITSSIENNAEDGPSPVYTTEYKGVPMYEIKCRNVAVAKRKSDSYMNATQILRVGGLYPLIEGVSHKNQRRSVLERLDQRESHEILNVLFIVI